MLFAYPCLVFLHRPPRRADVLPLPAEGSIRGRNTPAGDDGLRWLTMMPTRARAGELRSFAKSAGPFVLYTAGCLTTGIHTTTTQTLLRHLGERVVGVADHAAKVTSLAECENWAWAGAVPVETDALALLGRCQPAEGAGGIDLVVGISLPASERLLKRHRDEITAVADAGYRVFNGLYDLIDHRRVVNLRSFGDEQRVADATGSGTADATAAGAGLGVGTVAKSLRVTTIGTGSEAALLATTVGLEHALCAGGWTADWVPTSGEGMLLRGFGCCLDAVPVAFAATVAEELVLTAETEAEVVVVEGRGSVLARGAAATLAAVVAQTTRSDYHVLCHGLQPDDGDDLVPLLTRAASRHTALLAADGQRSTLLAVALDTSAVTELVARRGFDLGRTLGVPCFDASGDASSAVAALNALTQR